MPWGSGCTYPHFLDLGTSWRSAAIFTSLALYPLDRRLGGLQTRSRRRGEGKNLTLSGQELQTLRRPVCSQSHTDCAIPESIERRNRGKLIMEQRELLSWLDYINFKNNSEQVILETTVFFHGLSDYALNSLLVNVNLLWRVCLARLCRHLSCYSALLATSGSWCQTRASSRGK
jgi:hypothetical protein